MIVTNLTDNKISYENVFLHNIGNYGENEIYLAYNNVVYKSLSSTLIKLGHIGIGRVQRNHHGLAINDIIYIEKIIINKILNAKTITIKIHKLKQSNDIIYIHKDNFIKHVGSFKNYFSNDQKLLFDYKKTKLIGLVINSNEGFINPETEIKLITDDLYINIIDESNESNIMSRELFKDDFNFENIGIGGLDNDLAAILRRSLSSRAIKPSIIKKLGINHVKGIILHGPPGTGKTLIARNIGKILTKNPPIIINGPEILNKFVGQSEENLRNKFLPAKEDYDINGDNAKLHILIFDEIDAICKKRGSSGSKSGVTDSLVNQLLTILEGVNSIPNIFVIAMTNRIDLIDDALLRPGRIEVHVKIGLPDKKGRMQIFRIHTDKMKNNNMMNNINISDLASRTENFSGAEIESVVKNASSFAINELLKSDIKEIHEKDIIVTEKHFNKALNEIKPFFGNKNIKKIKLCELNNTNKLIYGDICENIKNMSQLETILIQGESKSGKTSIISNIAFKSNFKYIKLIKPIDVIRFDESEKASFLTDVAMDGYVSNSSLIILDDIEVLINFVDLGYNLSFSNKLYQTLLTIIKTLPNNTNNKLVIICTTNSNKLVNIIGKNFNNLYNIKNKK